MDALPDLKSVATGWYGKLPTRGDFVGRGLPRSLVRVWDGWLQRAVAAAAQDLGPAVLRERLATMLPWQALVWPQRRGEAAWSAVVVGSSDRVGRAFPLTLAEAFEPAGLATVDTLALRARGDAIARWLAHARPGLEPKDLDVACAAWASRRLACPAPDDTRPACDIGRLRLDHPGATSFWWPAADVATGAMQPVRTGTWPPGDRWLLDLLARASPGPLEVVD